MLRNKEGGISLCVAGRCIGGLGVKLTIFSVAYFLNDL